jgi:mono/diheme cytochrome c family protein
MRLAQSSLRIRWPAAATLLAIYGAVAIGTASHAAEPSGEQIYREQCARCHGASGEGTADNYPELLAGDKSVAQLATLIQETMPDDKDDKCSAEDAALVAAYIYDAFYSEDARLRKQPARIELARLTVRQHQNVLADLIGSFLSPAQWGSQRGLRGKYFSDRRFNPKAVEIERTDPEVCFDWGESNPDPQKFDTQSFSVAWVGSVLAPDTGAYEFLVRTEHAARLYVNDRDTPLIDAWVQSGDDTEHRGEIHLLGGRAYPVKLEFSRAKQGVNDKDKNKQEFRPKANTSVSLEWKRPNHTLEVVATRYLSVAKVPEVFVLATRFPPDDRSVGYERGTAISKSWDDATTEAALETAGYVAQNLHRLSGANPEQVGDKPVLRRFCLQFVEQAFRRPLSDDERTFYVQRQLEQAPDATTGVKRVVLLALKSPRFLYREVDAGAAGPYAAAARMSFGMWDSAPDRELLKAAAKGKLASREQIVGQLERMVPDLRTRSKLREFLLGWLKVSQPRDLAKDPKVYPEFTPEVASDLRTSLELSLEELLDSGAADYRQLLLDDAIWLNGRLAKVYGDDLPADAPFQKVEFESRHRAGVLSHPYLLASLAYTSASSPIHRGVFVSRSVLGRVLRPPQEAVAPLPPEMHVELSTRDRVALQTRPEACQGCHSMINPLGFTMENFDAIGRYRDLERDQPIDASGSYLTRSGAVERFRGIEDLAEFAAASDESQSAFVKQLFHHTVKQPILAYGPQRLPELHDSFAMNELNIHKLLIEIVATTALTTK